MSAKTLFIANWKMNKTCAEAKDFCAQFLKKYSPSPAGESDIGIAPPYTLLSTLYEAVADKTGILIGSQNVHWLDNGAHTGEISPLMIKEVGAKFAIIGHSERRQFYGETNRGVAKRAANAIKHGLLAIVCVGETREEFESGSTEKIVEAQLNGSLEGLSPDQTVNLVIAYEPVWAIGTGLAATPDIALKVHLFIRKFLVKTFGENYGVRIPILYGGSTTPDNVSSLLSQENINGALVGGASLQPDVFWTLIEKGRAAKVN